jgi:hypothetical protein
MTDDELDTLASLYVQLRQLHGSLRLADVAEAIEETLINLVGTEDFAVYVRDGEGDRFGRLFSVGDGGAAIEGFTLHDGPLGSAAATRDLRYGDPVATVPLRGQHGVGGFGLMVIFRLLPHKPAITPRDRKLLEVFAAHAALALQASMCAAEHGERRWKVAEMSALLRDHRPPPTFQLSPSDGEEP